MLRKEVVDDLRFWPEWAIKHLWRDEIGDIFALTKHMEVNVFSKGIFSCICWHKSTYLQLQKMCVIFDCHATDDRLYCFKIVSENLPLVFELGAYKRRPYYHGVRIRKLQEKLGHDIKPFKPSVYYTPLVSIAA